MQITSPEQLHKSDRLLYFEFVHYTSSLAEMQSLVQKLIRKEAWWARIHPNLQNGDYQVVKVLQALKITSDSGVQLKVS